MIKKLAFLFLLLGSFQMQSQTVFGKWKTIDDKTGETKSVVEVYEINGKLFGKIIEIIDATRRNKKCEKCEGIDKNKSVLGLVIIKGLTKDDAEYNGGKILDPESGNIYKCILKLSSKDKLEVRGYMGFALIGRSQTWLRVK